MKKLILLFFVNLFVMLILNAKIIPLPDLVNPASVTLDENQLYITEGTSIYIYSLPDFKLIKKWKRK